MWLFGSSGDILDLLPSGLMTWLWGWGFIKWEGLNLVGVSQSGGHFQNCKTGIEQANLAYIMTCNISLSKMDLRTSTRSTRHCKKHHHMELDCYVTRCLVISVSLCGEWEVFLLSRKLNRTHFIDLKQAKWQTSLPDQGRIKKGSIWFHVLL